LAAIGLQSFQQELREDNFSLHFFDGPLLSREILTKWKSKQGRISSYWTSLHWYFLQVGRLNTDFPKRNCKRGCP